MTTEPTSVSTRGIDGQDAGVDAMLDLLGSRHRRRVLSALVGRRAPVALDDLAATVGAREAERATDASTGGRERLRTTLHHVHLPKLDDAGLVEYDADERTAAGTDTLDSVTARLSAAVTE